LEKIQPYKGKNSNYKLKKKFKAARANLPNLQARLRDRDNAKKVKQRK
jgi:hypothetical protein